MKTHYRRYSEKRSEVAGPVNVFCGRKIDIKKTTSYIGDVTCDMCSKALVKLSGQEQSPPLPESLAWCVQEIKEADDIFSTIGNKLKKIDDEIESIQNRLFWVSLFLGLLFFLFIMILWWA